MLCRRQYRDQLYLLSKLQSFVGLHHFSSPTDNTLNSLRNQQLRQWTPLDHQIVPGTSEQNCRSDLIALSFFMCCARQPDYFHEKSTFNHMVFVVSNLTQKLGTVKGIVQELETVGCETKAQTFLLLMRIYWRGAMYDMVFEAFEEMGNYGYVPNTYARNIVMDVLFKVKHVDLALRVLKETQAPNFLSFSIAVCNLCRLSDVHNVTQVLQCMLLNGFYLNPDTYLLVLNCFCRFSRLAEALQLLGLMIILGVPVSMNVWSMLIDGFCKSGKIEVAACLLEKMFEIRCFPNVVTCTPVIKAFLESQMPDKAFEILGTLESKGCFPDLVLCNVLIDCLSKMGWYDAAIEVFLRMRELKLTPDPYTYSSLVTAICLSRQYVLLPLLTSDLCVQPDLVVCNCLLSYFWKGGYFIGAVELYNDMIDRGFQPDNYSFTGLLGALCRLGRIQEAINVYQGIVLTAKGLDAHVHTTMISGLIKSGCFHRAIRLFRKVAVEKFILDVVSYNVVIGRFIRYGLTEDAYSLFEQMKQLDIAPNMHSYNLILSGFCKDGDVKMVLCIVQEMMHKKMALDNNAYKFMKRLLLLSPHSHTFFFNLLTDLKNLGLLPKDAQALLATGYDVGIVTSFDCAGNSLGVLDHGLPRCEELPTAFVSAG